MSVITTINSGDLITNSRATINNNFSNLNAGKIETSVIDTDTTMAADSDAKIASQKAIKAYVDAFTGGITKARVRAYKSSATAAYATSYTQLTFETENYDTGSNFASNTFTAPRTAYYSIVANVNGTSTSSGTTRTASLAIYKNGAVSSQVGAAKPGIIGNPFGLNISDVLLLTAGDTIRIYAYCDFSEANINSGSENTYISIIEL